MDPIKHSQKVGTKLRDKKGTDFFSNINPKKKLSSEKVKEMLEDFRTRTDSGNTVPMIAKKYGITTGNVYYHARRNGQ